MICATNCGDQVKISFSGSEYDLMNDICGVLVWSLESLPPERISMIMAAVYEECDDDPAIQSAWDEAEVLFAKYRLKKWNQENNSAEY